MQGMDWRTLHIPFGSGLSQRADDRALPPPALARAVDVQFEEVGGLQTRYPFATAGASIFGGGTISNARRIVKYGDERLLFTDESLYSWNAQLSKWVLRGTHLAVATDERAVHITTGDQIDGDRAQLSSTVIFAWVDASGLWVAAEDATTGSVLMAPTLANALGTRPRLVALTTKILLFWIDTAAADLECIAIDPAAPATAVAGAATTVLATTDDFYDVVKVPAADTAIGAVADGGNYAAFTVTAGLTVVTSAKARACDGPIAIAADPTGTVAQVIRADTTNIVGDRLTISTLADAATAQAIGDVTTIPATPTNQIAAAYRSVQDSGAYRCYVFWSAAEVDTGATTFATKSNYVDTGGTIGTQAVFLTQHGVASRAFDHDGRVFVHLAFAGASVTGALEGLRAQLQNTYFLYRDDALLVAKMAMHRAGGFAATAGRLPEVQSLGSNRYAWCGTERRVIPVGTNHLGYSDRGPREIAFTFDDNRARRCAQLGGTLYITGGEIMQFDRTQLAEVGYHVFPWRLTLALAATGNVEDGTYSYKGTWRWDNAAGERDRSTTATVQQIAMTGGPRKVTVASVQGLQPTHKTGVAFEVWRTAKDPPIDAPFFLVTSQDPADLTNPNRYLPVPDPDSLTLIATLNDELADSVATTNESNPENGAILENLAPPAANIIAAYGSRVFLGGVAGDPRRIWYSKLRGEGEVVSFHDGLTVELPLEGGDLVALAFLDGILVAFCETATYMLPGDGFDNAGGGTNYGPARAVSHDVGCRDHDSVTVMPLGIVFQSGKGKYLLTRGWTMQPIGLAVVDYDSETVLAAHVDEKRHHVRWLTASRLLVWDYLAPGLEGQVGQWAEWSVTSGVHAVIWGGTYHYLTAAGPFAEQTSYTGTAYGLDVETAWIKPADLQGAVLIRKLKILGEYRSACNLLVRVYNNYKAAAVQTKAWTATPTTVGDPLELVIAPRRPACEAVKLRITVKGASTAAHLHTDGGGAGELTDKIALRTTPASDWTAILDASRLGDLGNSITFSIAFVESTTASVTVNDHAEWNVAASRWDVLADNLGILVTGNDTTAPVTVTMIEDAIDTWSTLASIATPHATGSDEVDFATMIALDPCEGTFHDGAFAAATGEAIKLTGLALELGYQRGLYRRLPAAQRT